MLWWRQFLKMEVLHKIASKFGTKYKGQSKKPVCDGLAQFCARREDDNYKGVVTPVDEHGQPIIFNIYCFLNVMFSDEFRSRFASCGTSLTEEDLNNKVESDQRLY